MVKRVCVSYDILNTELKRLTRTIISDLSVEVLGDSEDLKGFSLPASNFLFEKEINRRQEMVFSGVEQDKVIFEEGKNNSFENIGTYENKSVREFFQTNSQRFNLIWLDYCSNFNIKMVNDLKIILSEDNFDLSESNGIFGLTVAGNRDPQIKIVTKFMGIEDTFENRATARLAGIPLLLMHYVEQWNSGIELVPMRHIKYHDELEGKRVPMFLHLFKVKKNFGDYTKYKLGTASVVTNKRVTVNV